MRHLFRRLSCILLPLVLAACAGRTVALPPVAAAPPTPRAPTRLAALPRLLPVSPAAVGMDSSLGHALDSIIALGIAQGAAPGVAIAVGRHGRLVHLAGYGTLDYAPGSPAVTPATIYDLASLTKVIATTTLAMQLEEQGKLDLSRTVASYLPAFNAPDKAAITVRMLLTHSGGLEAYAPLFTQYRGREEFIRQINLRPLRSAPGTVTTYSDWDIVVLQAVIETITAAPLDSLAAQQIFRPLGMADTRFRFAPGDTALLRRTAPTAIDTSRGGLLRGVVHDGNAWAIGGVSGHAGLFSSASDLAVFAQMLLNGGVYDGARIAGANTIARWTARQSPASSRALGWDTPAPTASSGRYFSPRSFGHTGFTGTSVWVDPERDLFVVLLMNRVNSRGEGSRHTQLRRDVSDAVQRAVLDAPLVEWELRR